MRVGTTEQVVKNYLRKSLRQAGASPIVWNSRCTA